MDPDFYIASFGVHGKPTKLKVLGKWPTMVYITIDTSLQFAQIMHDTTVIKLCSYVAVL